MVPTDNQLLTLYVKNGDEAAFQELLHRHSSMVLNVCRNLAFQKDDAEDAFQVVFVLLSIRAPKLLGHRSISGWLHITATRTCLQLRRARVHKREVNMHTDPIDWNEPWQTITHANNLDILHREFPSFQIGIVR